MLIVVIVCFLLDFKSLLTELHGRFIYTSISSLHHSPTLFVPLSLALPFALVLRLIRLFLLLHPVQSLPLLYFLHIFSTFFSSVGVYARDLIQVAFIRRLSDDEVYAFSMKQVYVLFKRLVFMLFVFVLNNKGKSLSHGNKYAVFSLLFFLPLIILLFVYWTQLRTHRMNDSKSLLTGPHSMSQKKCNQFLQSDSHYPWLSITIKKTFYSRTLHLTCENLGGMRMRAGEREKRMERMSVQIANKSISTDSQ